MISSGDSGQGQSLCTPRRVQKTLCDVVNNSSKRKLFQTDSSMSRGDTVSGEESDLGPMSPLTISDSEIESSSGREYLSPFTTPEKSPSVLSLTWDRLRLASSNKKHVGLSPFSSLKKLTHDARSSPRRKIYLHSPKTLSSSPNKSDLENQIPASPTQIELESFMDDIVPETPQKDCISQTPQKVSHPERRLITPLGSACKEIVIPPLHRRKSICTYDSSDESSPTRKEYSLKRHASNSLNMSSTKLMKMDESHSIPKARASLFKDDEQNTPKLLTLSTKSFYNNVTETKRHSFGFGKQPITTKPKKRRSLPLNTHHRRSTGSVKKQKFGEINAGVRHGIKRPKMKKKKRQSSSEITTVNDITLKTEVKENSSPSNANAATLVQRTIPQPVLPRAPSPIEDPNKRFFKTNKTIKVNNKATITVNGNIKLQVVDGKIALNQNKKSVSHVNKKPKLHDVPFDAADLTVNDPNLDKSINQNDVAGILKILENDWADDEYDSLKPLTPVRSNAQHSNKSVCITDDVMLSPASVLSTMTSSMNIKDRNSVNASEKNSDADSNRQSTKLYPLFTKGFTNNVVENTNEKRSRGVKRPANWQLSTKINGDNNQYQLDAGQKRFGTTQCHECGVIYQIGEPQDENAHLIYHNSIKTLKYNGWKNERIVYQNPFNGDRIVTIEASDPKYHWNKVEEVLAVVDKDLGLSDTKLSDCHNKKIYLYVKEKSIVGVLVAESIKIAHRMIPEFFELDCCSEESTPVKCGVNVVWTAPSHRQQGIARKLVDVLRSNYFYGYIMTLDDIAFSIPSSGGKIFAEKYTKSRDFKVYSDPIDALN